MKYILRRTVTKEECPWLEKPIYISTIVFEYFGTTYGCISHLGKAFSRIEGETPFFELPKDSVTEIHEP